MYVMYNTYIARPYSPTQKTNKEKTKKREREREIEGSLAWEASAKIYSSSGLSTPVLFSVDIH